MHLISSLNYFIKYNAFINSPQVNDGICFGMCYRWLRESMAEYYNHKGEDILKLNIADDFLWRAYSAQREEASASDTLICTRFIQRNFRNNKADLKKGTNCTINLEEIYLPRMSKAINDFFSGEVKANIYGLLLPLEEYSEEAPGHAVALLQLNEKRYLFDPNIGVFLIVHPGYKMLNALNFLRLYYQRLYGDFNTHMFVSHSMQAFSFTLSSVAPPKAPRRR